MLVNSQGMTLYHLSGEQNGKSICTSSACVAVWRPVTATSGGTPSGSVGSLGTVTRPAPAPAATNTETSSGSGSGSDGEYGY